MTAFVLSQILIGVVFIISVITFQFRRPEHVLVCCVAITFLMADHFWLLDAQSAALLSVRVALHGSRTIPSITHWTLE